MHYLILLLSTLAASAETRLTLRDAVQMALANNPELLAERAQRDSASPAIEAAKGAFDPVFGLRGGWRQTSTPASSILQGVNGRLDERFWSQSVEARQRLPWLGMRWETALENQRVATSNPFTSLNPYYQLLQRDSLVIPLGRFRKTDEFRTELKIRQREKKALAHDFAAHVLELVHRVEAAYWNRAAAAEALAAARAVEQAAAESLASTERQVREGEMSEADLAGALGQHRRAQEARATAEGASREAEAHLKSLLAPAATDPIWRESIVAAEREADQPAADAASLTTLALDTHPELAALAARLDMQQHQVQLASSAAAPQIDLTLSQTRQGLAGRSVPQGDLFPGLNLDAPPQLIGNLGRALSQAARNRFPSYEVGLAIELPLRNRAAEGRLAQQRLLTTRVEALRRQAGIQLASGIAQSWARLDASRQRMTLTREAVTFSEARLASEFRLFREGQSNNLNLNTRQNELAQSRQLLVEAQRTYNLAAADLRRLSATCFTDFKITLE
jgi:outer membrane protein TolC